MDYRFALRQLTPKKRMLVAAAISRQLIECENETPQDYEWLFLLASWLQVAGVSLAVLEAWYEVSARAA